MRWIVLVGLAIGCNKDAAPPQRTAGSGSGAGTGAAVVAGDASVAVVDAQPAWIDLLRAVPATVRVSSKVANKAIRPEHLVDRDLQTAWNSVTGELAGAWVEIELPPAVTVGELRLTIGHTGKGPKGEDYFAMNHRITKVTVERAGAPVGTFALDPTRRELQPIAAAGPGGTLRIRVDEVVAGTKPAWREVAISELEVWGVPPAGWTAPARPLVPHVVVAPPPPPAALACDATLHGDDCELTLEEVDLAPPWTGVGLRCVPDPSYGTRCAVVVAHGGSTLETDELFSGGPHDTLGDVSILDAYVKDVLPGKPPELVVHYGGAAQAWLVVFRATPKPARSSPIQVGGSVMLEPDPDSAGPPDPYPSGEHWTVDVRFVRGSVVLSDPTGTAPKDVLGKHPLQF